MKVITDRTVEVTITMNREEALYLRNLMRKPHHSSFGDEDEKAKSLRFKFFNAVKDV